MSVHLKPKPLAFKSAGVFGMALNKLKAAQAKAVKAPPPPPLPPGGGVPFSQTAAGLAQAHQLNLQALAIQRQNDEALARKQQDQALILQANEQRFLALEAERQRNAEAKIRREELARVRTEQINTLTQDREAAFVDMMKQGDQVRAVLFAIGVGPESDVFDTRARALGTTMREIKGATQTRQTTEVALSKVLERQNVTIGTEGVRNLGSAIGSARAFMQGGVDTQQLLTSAFGVGSTVSGEQPGISGARLQELVRQVSPTGALL